MDGESVMIPKGNWGLSLQVGSEFGAVPYHQMSITGIITCGTGEMWEQLIKEAYALMTSVFQMEKIRFCAERCSGLVPSKGFV